MPEVLQLPHLVEHHRVPQVQVGRSWVHAKLDAQGRARGLALLQLAQPIGLRQQFLAAPKRDRHGVLNGLGDHANLL